MILHKVEEIVHHVTEMTIESLPLVINTNFTNIPPNKANLVDWFLGVIGLRPPESEANLEPPKNCPRCCKIRFTFL